MPSYRGEMSESLARREGLRDATGAMALGRAPDLDGPAIGARAPRRRRCCRCTRRASTANATDDRDVALQPAEDPGLGRRAHHEQQTDRQTDDRCSESGLEHRYFPFITEKTRTTRYAKPRTITPQAIHRICRGIVTQ